MDGTRLDHDGVEVAANGKGIGTVKIAVGVRLLEGRAGSGGHAADGTVGRIVGQSRGQRALVKALITQREVVHYKFLVILTVFLLRAALGLVIELRTLGGVLSQKHQPLGGGLAIYQGTQVLCRPAIDIALGREGIGPVGGGAHPGDLLHQLRHPLHTRRRRAGQGAAHVGRDQGKIGHSGGDLNEPSHAVGVHTALRVLDQTEGQHQQITAAQGRHLCPVGVLQGDDHLAQTAGRSGLLQLSLHLGIVGGKGTASGETLTVVGTAVQAGENSHRLSILPHRARAHVKGEKGDVFPKFIGCAVCVVLVVRVDHGRLYKLAVIGQRQLQVADGLSCQVTAGGQIQIDPHPEGVLGVGVLIILQ